MTTLLALTILAGPALLPAQPAIPSVKPVRATSPVSSDADDPAIWVNQRDRARSLILGTDKEAAPAGGLYVWNLEGKEVQRIPSIDRPNNVDVRYGFRLGRQVVDIAVVTERFRRRLRIFAIDRNTGTLREVTGRTDVLAGVTGEAGEPMGIALYTRPSIAAGQETFYAIVSPKTGPTTQYLAQYRLVANRGRIDAVFVRRFGNFSGNKEIEALFVDDALSLVYASDETVGTRMMPADPDAVGADMELGFFNTTGFMGDHEGIGLYAGPGESGYLVFTDQLEAESRFYVRPRSNPAALTGIFVGSADDTDGIEVTSENLGPEFPEGLMVAMNSKDKNFLIYDWREIRKALGIPPLQ
jgi:3-phytase